MDSTALTTSFSGLNGLLISNIRKSQTVKDSNKYFLDGSFNKLLAVAIDKVGYPLLRHHRGGPINRSNIRKILLVRLDHLGDILMTTPAIRALRKSLPKAEIHLLVREDTLPAVELNPYLDRIITFNAPWTATGGNKATIKETLSLIGRLRRENYDCVVAFRADLREALLARFTGAPYRLGYGARGGGFCFTHLADYEPDEHEIRRAINLLRPLGVGADGEEMDFIFSPEDMEKGESLLRKAAVKSGSKTVGIHPGAASPSKRWTQEGFARLGDLLIEGGYQAIFLEAPGERGLIRSITGRMKNSPPVIRDMTLKVMGALIRRLDCLVCQNSAPSHIAQAVGTRAVVLYGPTHDAITGPVDRGRHTVVRNPVPCSPCWLPGRQFHCAYDLQCWKGLKPESVMEAIAVVPAGSRRL